MSEPSDIMAAREPKTGADTYSGAISEAVNYTRWIIDVFRPYIGRNLLEVGLGHGSFRTYLPSGIGYVGSDIDETAVRDAARENPADRYIPGDIADQEFIDKARNLGFDIDTVLCANVLEHVENDVLAVQNLMAIMVDEGKLLLYLPAHMNLFGTMDELAGHYRRYTKQDLPRISEGFHIRKWGFINPIAAIGWWANRRTRYRSLNEPNINRQIRLFDRYILPVSRLFTPFTKNTFGLSLYCVIEKK